MSAAVLSAEDSVRMLGDDVPASGHAARVDRSPQRLAARRCGSSVPASIRITFRRWKSHGRCTRSSTRDTNARIDDRFKAQEFTNPIAARRDALGRRVHESSAEDAGPQRRSRGERAAHSVLALSAGARQRGRPATSSPGSRALYGGRRSRTIRMRPPCATRSSDCPAVRADAARRRPPATLQLHHRGRSGATSAPP